MIRIGFVQLYYFYPRSPCGERRQIKQACQAKISISIHALLAESDFALSYSVPPLGLFLSTLSLRRATIDTSKDIIKTANFYPRSPCGERQFVEIAIRPLVSISIHALLAESDPPLLGGIMEPFRISIHALLAESDG